jgi:RimJ/RimL family protein N-acetyltransferase
VPASPPTPEQRRHDASGPSLRSERTLLRRWQPEDLAPFAQMNADPVVMEHFPATLTEGQTAGAIGWIEAGFDERGYGLWAVELPGEARFIGFVGLQPAPSELPFTPAVEIGWRLAPQFWGRGLATEAARVALAFAFEDVGLDEVVSFTAKSNVRSIAVMERIGLQRAGDFDNPRIGEGHRLRAHVLYRTDRKRWAEQRGR